MYTLSDQQVEFILKDIQQKGIHTEDLQQNLLDHICCILEREMNADDDFEAVYTLVLQRFYKNELLEIEQETQDLLTFKNFYFMKKVMILSGLSTTGTFMLGSICKVMHWPGASFFFVLAIGLLSFLFLPLLFLLKQKELKSLQEKLVLLSGVLVGMLYTVAVLASVMHWTMAKSGTYWLLMIGFSFFVFIPLYFFNGIRKPESKINTILVTCLMVIFMSLQFLMVNLRPITQTPISTVQAKQ